MTMVGYGRVSTREQSFETQLVQLREAGCEKIFSEKKSATTMDNRPALAEAMEWCRNGDVLVVVRLDRLARSTKDLLEILAKLEARGVQFKCLTQPIDTTTSAGRLMLTLLGAIAEFENEIRKERQRIGIDAAKARGVYVSQSGALKSADYPQAVELARQGYRPKQIAQRLKCGVRAVYKATPGMWADEPEALKASQKKGPKPGARKPNGKTRPTTNPPQHTLSEPTVAPKRGWLKMMLGV